MSLGVIHLSVSRLSNVSSDLLRQTGVRTHSRQIFCSRSSARALARRQKKSSLFSEVYQLQEGEPYLGKSLGTWFNHAENLSLTLAERLIKVEAISDLDDLYSIQFVYSNNKTVLHQIHQAKDFGQPSLSSVQMTTKSIREVVQCLKEKNGTSRLVGLKIGVENQTKHLLGSCYDQIHVADSNQNRVFAYATGYMDPYLQGFQLFWYKICSVDELVHDCVDSSAYEVNNSVYKD